MTKASEAVVGSKEEYMKGIVEFVDSVSHFIKAAVPVVYDGAELVKKVINKTTEFVERNR